ncbi:hypothetical protein [Fodinicola feengrottensis]|uniref:hypothetical protein n=1 Tax=Fodinicola feengrottensis TaxID=435914 RepID=UPI0013D408C8|nr:hypothetical protein [Fodinicola feengrottensis]
MSPVSRGRTKKKNKTKKSSREPSLKQIYAGVVDEFAGTISETDPLNAEAIASSIVGDALRMSDDYEVEDLGTLPLIGYAPGPAVAARARPAARCRRRRHHTGVAPGGRRGGPGGAFRRHRGPAVGGRP